MSKATVNMIIFGVPDRNTLGTVINTISLTVPKDFNYPLNISGVFKPDDPFKLVKEKGYEHTLLLASDIANQDYPYVKIIPLSGILAVVNRQKCLPKNQAYAVTSDTTLFWKDVVGNLM